MEFKTELTTKDIDIFGEQEFLKDILNLNKDYEIDVNSITAIIDWQFYYETRKWGIKDVGAYATGIALHMNFDVIKGDDDVDEDNEVEMVVGGDRIEFKDITYKGSGIQKILEAADYRPKELSPFGGLKPIPDFLTTDREDCGSSYYPQVLDIDFKQFPSFTVGF